MLKKNRKIIILNISLLLIAIILVTRILNHQSRQSLNLIVISVDTVRPDHMSLYGYTKKTTPNIDDWAKKAFVFNNARTVVPMTYPSFAAFFTGVDPINTRISKNRSEDVSPNLSTLPAILGKNGYKTTAFVTNVGKMKSQFGKFEMYFNKVAYYYEGKERYAINPSISSKKVVSDAQTWLAEHKDEKLFLWVHLMDPHTPYFPEDDLKCKFNKKYCGQILGRTLSELDIARADYQMCQNRGVPKERVELMETLYDGGIAEADKYIGQLLERIEDLGLDKRSLVVFYGDHGEGFDHNYYFSHREVLYESAIKIPLIIKDPLVNSRNKKFNLDVQNTDIFPTIIDLLGLKKEDFNVDGKSFSYLLNPAGLTLFQEKSKYSYYVNSNLTKYAVYDGRYKYIYSIKNSCLNNNQTEELFDLSNDPGEMNNLASANAKIKGDLENILFEHLSKYNLPRVDGGLNIFEDDYYKESEDNNQKNIDFDGKKEDFLNSIEGLGY